MTRKKYSVKAAAGLAKKSGYSLASPVQKFLPAIVAVLGQSEEYHVQGYNGVYYRAVRMVAVGYAIVPNPDTSQKRRAIIDLTPQACSQTV